MSAFTRAALAFVLLWSATVPTLAHSGPPYPIVTDAARGPYTISIWTDPDSTDDGTPGGQFWIVIGSSARSGSIPSNTRATVSIRALDADTAGQSVGSVGDRERGGISIGSEVIEEFAVLRAAAEPVRGDVTNQFATLVMDHEGPYSVRVDITGALGQASVDSKVDATYDLRPPPYMLVWYLVPFVLAGVLWGRLLLRRRAVARRRV